MVDGELPLHSPAHALQRFNALLVLVRERNGSVKCDKTTMAKIVWVQDDYIYEELKINLGLNMRSLEPAINVKKELGERAEAAYRDLARRVNTFTRECKAVMVATELGGVFLETYQKRLKRFGPAAVDAAAAATPAEKHSHQVSLIHSGRLLVW